MAILSMPYLLEVIKLLWLLPIVSASGNKTVQWMNPLAAIIGDAIIVQGGQRYVGDGSSNPELMNADLGTLYNISVECPIDTNAHDIDDLLESIEERPGSADPQTWWGAGMFWNNYEFYIFG